MRSWSLFRRAADPEPDPEPNECARAGCDAVTGSDVALYCTEQHQVDDAIDRLNKRPSEGVPAVPNPPANRPGGAP